MGRCTGGSDSQQHYLGCAAGSSDPAGVGDRLKNKPPAQGRRRI